VPAATRVAVLVSQAYAESTLREVEPAARAMGLQIQVVRADTGRDIHAAFAGFVRDRPDALFIGSGPFFNARRVQVVQLAARHALPTIYPGRQHVEIGGLISYGAGLSDAWYQVGAYAGRILKGAKASDLPVVQSSKFELVINADTARMPGLTVPPTLLATADEVIE
jgi:putative ABC transport system substrate-binding protein